MKLKRLLAGFVVMAMTAGMMSCLVFADESENEPKETTAVETTETEAEEKKPAAKETKPAEEEKPAESKAEEPSETEGKQDEETAEPEKKAPEEASDKEAEEAEEKAPESEAKNEAKDWVQDSGKCGKKVKWSLSNTGVLTISGKGKMYDYNYNWGTDDGFSYAPWGGYAVTQVIVKKGVTSIGEFAFSTCSSITSVSLPSTIKKIGYGAFQECYSLKTINLPKGLTSIGVLALTVVNLLKASLSRARSNMSVSMLSINAHHSRALLFQKLLQRLSKSGSSLSAQVLQKP